MAASVSIIVFKGDPVDPSELRHTALFLEFSDSTTILLHVIRVGGLFQTEFKAGENPESSETFIKKILVGEIKGQSKATIESKIKTTPVNGSDVSWDCHNWVDDALKKIEKEGWITSDARSKAIDDVVDAIVDAPDEP
ncbi:hypothetical protein MMC28_009048 [Mycoblastus sanguinarius]|nr:hypothetical protein [Mycoblastus sanguinarius]